MQSQRRAHRVISNAIYNLIPQLWFLALTVFTTPFVLHRLGVDAYGILSIVAIVAGYLAFLDLGLNLAVIKFIAAHDAKDESDQINRVVQTALFVFLLMAMLTAASLFFLSGVLARMLKVPAGFEADAVLVLRLGGLSFAVNLVMGVFSAVPRALQRFDIVNRLNIVLGTLQIVVTVILLTLGFGLLSIVGWGCVLSVISLITYTAIARRLLPTLRAWPRFDAKKFRELFGFSSYVMASNFTGVAASNSEKLILGGLAPIAQVTFYAVPFNIIQRVLTLIPSNLFTVLFPAFSAMSVTDKRETWQDAYIRAFRVIFIAVAPVSILSIVFGGDLLRFWIDESMSQNGGPVLSVLAIAMMINAPAYVCVTVGQSLGRPALVAAAQVVHLIVLVLCGLILVPSYGALGAALAWLSGNIIGIPLLLVLVNRYVLEFNTARMLKAALVRPLFAAIVTALAALALRPLIHGVVSLASASFVVTMVYLSLAYLVSLDARDRDIVKSFIVGYRPAFLGVPKLAKETNENVESAEVHLV